MTRISGYSVHGVEDFEIMKQFFDQTGVTVKNSEGLNGKLENKDLEGTVNPLVPKGPSWDRYPGFPPLIKQQGRLVQREYTWFATRR